MHNELTHMIGSLLMVGFLGQAPEDEGVREVSSLIQKGEVSNVILFRRNIKDSDQLQRLTHHLMASARGAPLPLTIAVDQEGGRVQRLHPDLGFPKFPSAKVVATYDDAQIRETYGQMADLLKKHNINMNLGPVIDLNLREESGVIGKLERAYSADPAETAHIARLFVEEHRKRHIWSCVKHPPGHGSAEGDTHLGWTDVSTVWQPQELDPLRLMLETRHVDSVMMAHTFNRMFDLEYPASLSESTVNGLLREGRRFHHQERDLDVEGVSFDGVVVTDDLHMRAVSDRYGIVDAAKRALKATGDVLILSHMHHATINESDHVVGLEVEKIHKAFGEDETLEPFIRSSYARIRRMKTASWENADAASSDA